MHQISVGVAFIAGVLSFLSPCVLPLVPGYISFLSGISLEELQQGFNRREIILKAGMASIFFVAGFSVVFVFLGASASFVGKFLAAHIRILNKVAGIIIIIFGLHLVGILKIGWLNVTKRLKLNTPEGSFFSAFLIGIAFAFGCTPCIGAILGGILALAAAQETVLKGIFLLAIYSLGLGIPFVITGFSVGTFMRFFQRYRQFVRFGEIAAGSLLIAMGVLIFFNRLTILLTFVPSFFDTFAM